MWYGKYLIYGRIRMERRFAGTATFAICPKANTPKWKAEQLLRELILKECNGVGPVPTLQPDDSVTFRWFVHERYIPMRQGKWSPSLPKNKHLSH
jgi:hypothetical protein